MLPVSTQFAHSSLMFPVIVKLLLRRALLAVPLVLAVVTLTFFFIRLAPGDPAFILAGDAPTPEFLAQIRAEYGLDQPVWTQFLAFPGTAMVVASILGIVIGVASAKRAGSRADALISTASLVGYSLPGFWLGQLL